MKTTITIEENLHLIPRGPGFKRVSVTVERGARSLTRRYRCSPDQDAIDVAFWADPLSVLFGGFFGRPTGIHAMVDKLREDSVEHEQRVEGENHAQ